MKKSVLLIMVLVSSVFILFNNVASAVSNDCSKCHGTIVSDFNVQPPDQENTCNACHRAIDSYHPYPRWIAQYISPVGYFRNAESLNIGAPTIHNYHNGANAWVNYNYCGNCHSSASCYSCHNNVRHGQHGIKPEISLPVYKVAYGDRSEFQALSCSTSLCHKFYAPSPGVIKYSSSGEELCYNCHGNGIGGHQTEQLNSSHLTFDNVLKIGVSNYEVSCSGCHSSYLHEEHQKLALENNMPEDSECGYCHMDTASEVIKNIVENIKAINSSTNDQNEVMSNRKCSACHFDLTLMPSGPAEHVMYHKAVNSNYLDISKGPHENCNVCHDTAYLQNIISELTIMPLEQRQYDCFICHREDLNMDPIHYAELDNVNLDILSQHQGCKTCHETGTIGEEKVQEIIGDLDGGANTYSCTDCHNDQIVLNEAHSGTIDKNCTQACHQNSLIDEHLSNPVTQISNEASPLTCTTCHNNQLTKVKLAISRGNTHCTACHDKAHNFNLAGNVSEDIVQFPGFNWSVPQTVEIWKGEEWMPDGYEGGYLIISNRRTDITISAVLDFYKYNMANEEWHINQENTLITENFFTLEFIKDQRKVTVFMYDRENHDLQSVSAGGYRLEILYK